MSAIPTTPVFRARMMKSFAEDGLMPAQRGDVEVSRAMSRVFHMLDEPSAFLKRPAIMARIMRVWAMPEAEKKRAAVSTRPRPDPIAPGCSRFSTLRPDRRFRGTDRSFPAPTMIKTNGIDMAVYEAGPKDGVPVVLCHGFPELAYSWRHQIPALAAAGFRAIAPDQRGYGLTSRPRGRRPTTTWRT